MVPYYSTFQFAQIEMRGFELLGHEASISLEKVDKHAIKLLSFLSFLKESDIFPTPTWGKKAPSHWEKIIDMTASMAKARVRKYLSNMTDGLVWFGAI